MHLTRTAPPLAAVLVNRQGNESVDDFGDENGAFQSA